MEQRNEYEAFLFGAWLNREHLEDMEPFRPDEFQNKRLFEAIQEGAGIRKILEVTGMRSDELATLMGSQNEALYLSSLQTKTNEALCRRLSKVNPADYEKTTEALNQIKEIQASIDLRAKGTGDVEEEYLAELTRRRTEKNPDYGVTLGQLNYLTGGIHRKELTIVAARPGCGKSSFALQVAKSVWRSGYKVLFFPLEMSRNQMIDRILVQDKITTQSEIRDGTIPADKEKEARFVLNRLKENGTLLFYEGIGDIQEIDRIMEKEQPFMVVIDQLSQMRTKAQRFNSDREQLQYMTNNLKAMAMRHDAAIMLLHQLNRSGGEKEKSLMDYLKGSGSCEEDADNVIIIQNYDNETFDTMKGRPWTRFDDETACELSLSKQRSGPTGKMFIAFQKDRFKFYERYD